MKTFKTWLTTMAVLLCSISASAYDFEVDEIRYDITSFTVLTVKASSISETLTGELVIPSKVLFNGKELNVTEIGDEFAVSNVAISSLTINEGINSIGSRAFNNCSNLTTVNIAQTVTQIGTECFAGCTSLNTFDNKGIVSIGSKSFAGCENLEEVSIESLTSLAEGVFLNCTKLSDCNLPNITSIGKEAFKNCQSLKEYNITNGVKSIGESAFEGCENLSSIIIPNNVSELEEGVFASCTALTSISIGAGILYLPWIFEGCTNLSDIRIEDSTSTLTFGYTGKRTFSTNYEKGSYIKDRESNYYPSSSMFLGKNFKNVYIGRNLTTQAYCYKEYYQSGAYLLEYYYYIPNPPFSESRIESLTIGHLVSDLRMYRYVKTNVPEVFAIGTWNGAFQNCVNLESVTIYSTVTSIPENTFSGCREISYLEIPNSIMEIGSNAFEGCRGLKNLSLGNNLTTIGDNAFEGCDSLVEINIKAHTPPTYETGFTSTHYINTHVNVPTGYLKEYRETEPWKNFWNLSEKNNLITTFEVDGIKYSVVSDKQVKIVGCNISIPTVLHLKNKIEYFGENYDVVEIGEDAFAWCEELTELVIPSSVTSIGDRAFFACTGLTCITIPNSVKTIGKLAFQSCDLTNIIIPSSVTSIGEFAFRYCSKLTSIVVDEYNPVYDSRDNCNAIIVTETDSLILGCKNTIIPNTVTNIGDYAFHECIGLTSITIPNSVKIIGNEAFSGCYGLTKLVIPSSVTLFNANALSDCDYLEELIFEDCDVPLNIPNGGVLDTQTSLLDRKVNGKTVWFKIEYYKPFFEFNNLKKLYIGRNLYMDSRYTLTGDGSRSDYYLIKSYDPPFSSLPELKELIIGKNVSVLGLGKEYIPEVNLYVTPASFIDCPAIKSVEVRNPEPPTGAEFSSEVYKNSNLYVPIDAKDSYAKAEGWKDFSNIKGCYWDKYFYINYIINGEPYAIDSVKYGDTIIPKEIPVKEGQTFGGWVNLPETMPANDITVYGTINIEPKTIFLNKQAIITTVNSVSQLYATVYPEDATDKTIIWSSSDESVAKVSKSGYITGISVGKATITASCGNASASCEVEVEVENFIKTQPTAENLLVELNTSEEGIEFQWRQQIVERTIYCKEIIPTSIRDYEWTESNGVWISENKGVESYFLMFATINVQVGDTISFDYAVPKGPINQSFIFSINNIMAMDIWGNKDKEDSGHFKFPITQSVFEGWLDEKNTATITFTFDKKNLNSGNATVSNLKHTRPTGFYKEFVDEEIVGATTARLDDSLFVEGSVVYCVVTLPNGKTLISDKIHTIKGGTGIEEIAIEESANANGYTVYNLHGILVMKTMDKTDLNNLPKGLYIVNGKKMLIK